MLIVNASEESLFKDDQKLLFSFRTSAEHCFVLEGRKRIRIIQKLRRKKDAWELAEVEVVSERWEADYNGGKELAGIAFGKVTPVHITNFRPLSLHG